MYRIDGRTPAAEVAGAIQLINEMTERLRRLEHAYGEWREFDAGAYFDLTPAQVAALLYVRERVSTVHVRFALDALLPSFQQALHFWAQSYAPAATHLQQTVLRGLPDSRLGTAFQQDLQQRMVDHRQQTEDVITAVRRALADDIAYLSMRGGEDERMRWQREWQAAPSSNLLAAAFPALNEIPTLTLVFDFPLPTARQPDRLRRLRRHRNRRRLQG